MIELLLEAGIPVEYAACIEATLYMAGIMLFLRYLFTLIGIGGKSL